MRGQVGLKFSRVICKRMRIDEEGKNEFSSHFRGLI